MEISIEEAIQLIVELGAGFFVFGLMSFSYLASHVTEIMLRLF